jgi:exonuclease III
MASLGSNITIGFINIRGPGLSIGKQLEIQQFILDHRIDICHLQEINIDDDTFSSCTNLISNYEVIVNNNCNKYGTASLVRSDLQVTNVGLDQEGRVIIFDIVGGFTCGNLYLPSGTSGIPKTKREHYCAEVIPQLLTNRKEVGICGGDMNCIVDLKDATKNPQTKMSPSLRSLVNNFSWVDSFRSLHPTTDTYSRYYSSDRYGEGASRIDRAYHWGGVSVLQAGYHSISFSDHMAHVIEYQLPAPMERILGPRARPTFKVKPDVVMDDVFKARLKVGMADWQPAKDNGLDVLRWWEMLVKPGIRRLAIERGRELTKERRGALGLLQVRQAYLTKKLQSGELARLSELREVNLRMEAWYNVESSKIALQSQIQDMEQSEKIRINHQSLHQKASTRTSILRLQTESGLLEGHAACAQHLEQTVAAHLLQPAALDTAAQQFLLSEVQQVFTEADNTMMRALPDKEEVRTVLMSCRAHAAPGTDGLTAHLYQKHWDLLGDGLTEVILAVFRGQQPTASQRTSQMVFGSKPKKQQSLKPSDKRKISLLNTDFKMISGLQAARLRSTMTRTVSKNQLVAGSDRRLHHGIALARDAIQAAGRSRAGCGILDTDLISAFCNMVLTWSLLVLRKKGLCEEACARIANMYKNNYSIVVVNNVLGRCIENKRLTIRQGDKISMELFVFGIDPVLEYLESRLRGIPIFSLPVEGPQPAPGPPTPGPPTRRPAAGRQRNSRTISTPPTLPPLESRYILVGYCDDLKPAITSMDEFLLVDRIMTIFERSSGCPMHRDPTSGKCKFLPLGRWRGTLTQEDLPCNFFRLSEHLDMLGVTLKATYTATRKANGEELVARMRNVVGPWRAGRHMALTMRPHLLNSTAFSKLYHRCTTGDLRVADSVAISKLAKSWLYADMLEKPEQLALHRDTRDGGLGLHRVDLRALAFLISSFLETAVQPAFQRVTYHEALFRYYVLDEPIRKPELPPYFRGAFFPVIRRLHASPLGTRFIKVKQIYRFLIEEELMTEEAAGGGPRALLPLRVELSSPGTDWPRSWRLARQRGLGPQLSSFLYKLLHQILPTGERVARILPAASPACTRCEADPPALETLYHSLFACPANHGVTASLVAGLRHYMPLVTPLHILTLDFQVAESMELPVTWVTATFLSSLWTLRTEARAVHLYKIRSDLESACRILTETKFQNEALLAGQVITDVFS